MSSDLPARLADVIRSHRILRHPFYEALSGGLLTPSDLRAYASLYGRHVEAFGQYLLNLVNRLPEEANRIIFGVLTDALEQGHTAKWSAFAEGVGLSPWRQQSGRASERSIGTIEFFDRTTRSAPIALSLGAVYANEAQMEGAAGELSRVLTTRYDLSLDEVEYFVWRADKTPFADNLLHALTLLEETTETHEQAVEGVTSGAQAIWNLLDVILTSTRSDE